MSIVIGSPSIAQNRFAHGPGATTSCSPTSIRPWSVSTAATESSAAELEARSPRRRDWIVTPSDAALAASPATDVEVEREAALVLVEADRHALRAPVGEELLHVRVDRFGPPRNSSER